MQTGGQVIHYQQGGNQGGSQYPSAYPQDRVQQHLNGMQHYFGDPLEPIRNFRADKRFSRETWRLPDAYKGQNTKLATIIEFFVREGEDWPTTEVLPWTYSDNIEIQWNMYKFDRSLAGIEAPQGVPRFVTSTREGFSDRLLRRGIAFIIEHEFYTTEEGRMHYKNSLKQIAQAMRDTANYDVFMELLSAHRQYGSQHRILQNTTVKRYSDLQHWNRWLWGVVQKQNNGLDLVVAKAREIMNEYTATKPTMIILPQGVTTYLNLVPPRKSEFFRQGPKANIHANDPEPSDFHGLRVRESYSIMNDAMRESVDPLTRRRQMGSYYRMVDHYPKSGGYAPYTSDCRSILIHDMDTDRMQKITLLDAMESVIPEVFKTYMGTDVDGLNPCQKITAHLNLCKLILTNPDNRRDRLSKTHPDSVWPEARRLAASIGKMYFGEEYRELRKDTEILVNYAMHYLGYGIEDTALYCTNDNGLNTWVRHRYDKDRTSAKNTKWTAVLAKFRDSHPDIDAPVPERHVGLNEFVIGDDFFFVPLPIMEGDRDPFYNYYINCTRANLPVDIGFIVARPFQTYNMASAILLRHGQELGNTFYGHADMQLSDDVIQKVHVGHFTQYTKAVVREKKNIMVLPDVYSRGYVSGGDMTPFKSANDISNYVDEPENTHMSLIFIPIPADTGIGVRPSNPIRNPIDLTGVYPNWIAMDDGIANNGDHWPGSETFMRDLGIRELLRRHNELPVEFDRDDTYVNTVCWQGHQIGWDYYKSDFSHVVRSTDAWGHTYEGCGQVRNGESKFLRRDAVADAGPLD